MVTVNNNTYGLTRATLGDKLALTKNCVPVLEIPEILYEDFVQILAHAGSAAKFLSNNPPKTEDEQKVNILSATKTD